MVPELIIVDIWAALMTFFTVSSPVQSYLFQNNFENISQ